MASNADIPPGGAVATNAGAALGSGRGRGRAERGLIALLHHPRLPWILVALAWLLSAPSLGMGFYLDDFIGRYIYQDFPHAERLRHVLSGGYGVANGVPRDMRWQIDQGYAPWWANQELLVALWRPLGILSYRIDMALWPDSPALQRLHGFLWLGLMLVLATRLYRRLHGAALGGLAALLLAFDHTHGYTVGYITNRHLLQGMVFAIVCLDLHIRARRGEGRSWTFAAAVGCYALGLLSSEASLSVSAYLFGYAMFVESGPLWRRARSLLPYFLVTVAWRAYYTAAGYGARGSGLYIDPAREPLKFLGALAERGPVLLNGLFFAPPAEVGVLLDPPLSTLFVAFSVLVVTLLALALRPVLARERLARMWAAGMLLSLVPAAATYPHNRQLMFASLGGMALLAQTWHLFAVELEGRKLAGALRWSGRFGAFFLGMHLLVSPLLLPFTTCSSLLLRPLQRAMTSVGDEVGGREAIYVSAPDYLAPKLVLFNRYLQGREPPRRTRGLSFGPIDITATRTAERELVFDYHGGILQDPLTELYRDRRLPMAVGQRIQLRGLTVEVLGVTRDGRVDRARFRFDAPLEDPRYRFYVWSAHAYSRWTPPAVGQRKAIPPARMRYGL